MKKYGILNSLTNEIDYFTSDELIAETNNIICETYDGYEVKTISEAIEILDDNGYEVIENISGAIERIISKNTGGF